MAGRPRKPTALKLIEGNPGKRPLPENEPKPAPIPPDCPKWLLADAKKEWQRLAPELESMGLLTRIDMAALAAYCQSYARWKQAEAAMGRAVKKGEDPNGWENVARQRQKEMIACAKEFGFTPVSRTKVSAVRQEEDDEFSSLLSG